MGYLIPFFLFVVTGSAAAKMDFLVGVVSGRWNESPQPLDWVAGMLITTVAISASVGCYDAMPLDLIIVVMCYWVALNKKWVAKCSLKFMKLLCLFFFSTNFNANLFDRHLNMKLQFTYLA